jgi:glutaredoxin-related protein
MNECDRCGVSCVAFPQIIVKGELIGGLDILKEMIASGEFAELIQGI